MICRKCRREVADGPFCLLCGAKQAPTSKSVRRRGNGTGTAFKRGRTWTAQYTKYTETKDGVKSRRYATKGGFATKKDALAYLDAVRSGRVKSEAPTLLELWEIYRDTDMVKLSKDKQTAYKKARERLECIIGRRIDTLTTTDLQTAVNSHATSYYTARDMKNLLSHFYKRACADQYVPSNLSQFIVLPESNESEPEPFTQDEIQKMWSAWADGEVFAGYMLLMIYSGMMPGELLSVLIENIDADKCEIYRTGKKTAIRKERPIVFAKSVQPIVEGLMGGRTSGKLVKANKDNWYKDYHVATKKLGVRDLPPYSCRHTTGTEAAKIGLNAAYIQEVMRHAKITTSQRYIHTGAEQAHVAINTLDANKTEKSQK